MVRWWMPPWLDGGEFGPRPDGLEYAAAAQSIAQDGRFMLNVGPWSAPPRYSPGFPMLLAVALRVGVAPENLVRVNALADAGLAVLLAAVAAGLILGLVSAVRPASRTDAWRFGAPVGAALVGLVLALTPAHVLRAKLLHSDQVTVLVAALALAAWVGHLWPRDRPTRWSGALPPVFAGLTAGWVALARPIEGVLLLPVLVATPFALGHRRLAVVARSSALATFAAAVPIAMGALLLIRSGRPPWPWTAYDFWQPRLYGSLDGILGWRFFIGPWELRNPVPTSEWPGWLSGLATLTGFPLGHSAIGPAWPVVGWLSLGVCWFLLRSVEQPMARRLTGLLSLLALWTATHALFFPFYFYRSMRFYLVALHIATLMTGVAAGVLLASRSRRAAAFGLLIVVSVTTSTAWRYRRFLVNTPVSREPIRATREVEFRDWLALADLERRERSFPFDPLQAQAFGWLSGQRVDGIREWGTMPGTLHVRRLRRSVGLPGKGGGAVNPGPRAGLPARAGRHREGTDAEAEIQHQGFERGLDGWDRVVGAENAASTPVSREASSASRARGEPGGADEEEP